MTHINLASAMNVNLLVESLLKTTIFDIEYVCMYLGFIKRILGIHHSVSNMVAQGILIFGS